MTLLRNTNAPVHGPGGLFWETVKHEVEVAHDLASELLRIPHAGFVEVTDDKDAQKAEEERIKENKAREAAQDAEAKAAAKKADKDAKDGLEQAAADQARADAEKEKTIAAAEELARTRQAGQEQVPGIAPTDEVAPEPLNALTEPAPVGLPINEKSPLTVKTPDNDRLPASEKPDAIKPPAKK